MNTKITKKKKQFKNKSVFSFIVKLDDASATLLVTSHHILEAHLYVISAIFNDWLRHLVSRSDNSVSSSWSRGSVYQYLSLREWENEEYFPFKKRWKSVKRIIHMSFNMIYYDFLIWKEKYIKLYDWIGWKHFYFIFLKKKVNPIYWNMKTVNTIFIINFSNILTWNLFQIFINAFLNYG